MQQRVAMLKEEVRTMFSMSSTAYDGRRVQEEMNLVDDLQRLGLAYHFEKEISEALARIHGSQMMVVSDDLHTIALRFRLLRRQGYDIPSDEFNKFMDVHGHFRGSLSSDIHGLLSLYEASYLGTQEDGMLEEAMSFYRRELEHMLDRLQPPLAAEVLRALDMPLVRRIKRLEAREYLSFYEATEGRNDVILELAKLDFNRVQSLHQEEIKNLTRWDIGELEVPEYMKAYFVALSNTLKEFGDKLLEEQKSYCVRYLKEEFKAIAKAYLKEAEWCNEGHTPTFQDHLHVSLVSSGTSLLTCGFFLCMRDIATPDTVDWLASNPKIVEASAMITRLIGDIASHEFEENRQHVASTVRCYMKDFNVPEEMACQKLRGIADTAWKVMNEEWIQPTQIPMQLLTIPFELARVIEIYYKSSSDGYTHSSSTTKDLISLLLVKRIPL